MCLFPLLELDWILGIEYFFRCLQRGMGFCEEMVTSQTLVCSAGFAIQYLRGLCELRCTGFRTLVFWQLLEAEVCRHYCALFSMADMAELIVFPGLHTPSHHHFAIAVAVNFHA